MQPPRTRTGAQLLVDSLLIHGADLAFCVAGESYLSVLDALYDAREQLRLITCRHEAAAANMAEAAGKLTGRPGICFVTRGPGATHASIGLHTAFQDSTPLILFVGQVARGQMEREAFQELDYRRFFNPQISKWTAEIDDARRIPEFVSRAFHTAVNGRPGPVVLTLPDDMLDDVCEVPGDASRSPGRFQVVQAAPEPARMADLRERLLRAERPLLMLGGGGWTDAARRDIQKFAENFQLPTAAAFRCQDVFDNRHPLYAGDIGLGSNATLARRVRETDLLLAVGPRLGEATTSGYTLLEVPRPAQPLVHVHPGAEELGRVYAADLLIQAAMPAFAAAAAALPAPESGEIRWRDWTAAAHAEYLDFVSPLPTEAAVDLAQIVSGLSERLPPRETIVCNGAGNYAGWVHRYYRYPGCRAQLAPTSGAMGYGVPAALAAKLIHPDRPVVCFAGDGDFLMAGQELATAARYGLGAIFIVVNNGSYGTIRMHQEMYFPGRVYGTELTNPDFVALARAYGLRTAERVERTADFWPAFERAQADGGPALIELVTAVEYISARTTITALRERARPA